MLLCVITHMAARVLPCGIVDEPSMRWRSVERMARLLNIRCLSRLGLLSPCGILTSLFSLSIHFIGIVRLLGSISNSLSCSMALTRQGKLLSFDFFLICRQYEQHLVAFHQSYDGKACGLYNAQHAAMLLHVRKCTRLYELVMSYWKVVQ